MKKTFDPELTNHALIPCKKKCYLRFFNGGVSLIHLKPEKQNEKLEVLTADDFNLR